MSAGTGGRSTGSSPEQQRHEDDKPAISPAIAMSKSAVRLGNASRILITAPSVPDSDGNGRKKGSVASTP
jgi:hypothetical protein